MNARAVALLAATCAILSGCAEQSETILLRNQVIALETRTEFDEHELVALRARMARLEGHPTSTATNP